MSASNSSWVIALGVLGVLAGGCGGDDGDSGDTNGNAQPLTCVPNEPRACPCVSAATAPAMGMQVCNATGNGYSACTGCPALSNTMAGTSGGTLGGASGAAGVAGMTAGAGGAAGAGTTGGAGGGTPDGGTQTMADASEPEPAGDVAPGASCGVGLVTQCAQDTEKCCVRSLETDSCIGADEACTCGLQNCETLEVHCDGPEDCGDGEVCCGTLSQSGAGYDNFLCATTCQGGGNQRVACHAQDPQCEGGDICANSQLLTNVQVCIDPATIQQ